MKYVSEKYERQLHDLAETLCTPARYAEIGQLILFANDAPEPATGPQIPPTLRLCDPPELGWEYQPDGAA